MSYVTLQLVYRYNIFVYEVDEGGTDYVNWF